MEANNKMREEALRWAKESGIKIMRAAYEQYPHCLTEDDLIVELYKDAIDEAKALAWWNDCKYQDALCRLHFPGKFTRGLLSPEIVAIYKAEHPELNKGEGIEDITNTRTIALNWWRQQSDQYKEMQFNQYKKEYFTPAIDFRFLTGREIEVIYSNIGLSERANKNQGIEDIPEGDLLEGITPGEWESRGNKIFVKGKTISICEVHVQKNYEDITFKPIEDIEARANQRLLLSAPRLARDNKALREENEKMKKELEAMYSLNKEGWGKVEYYEKRNEVLYNALETIKKVTVNTEIRVIINKALQQNK